MRKRPRTSEVVTYGFKGRSVSSTAGELCNGKEAYCTAEK